MNHQRKPLRIAFAGTPEFAASHLEAVIQSDHKVVGVYTQPDRPAGRGRKPTPSAVKTLALNHNLPVYQPVSLKSQSEVEQLAQLSADVFVVVAYGLILPQSILETPPLGCINVHASQLPKWRGAAPIQRAIAAGDTTTGITIMAMDIGLDTGDMLNKASCPIGENETSGQLHDKLVNLGCELLLETLHDLPAALATRTPQDNQQATYAEKITKEEACIDWLGDCHTLHHRICAFNPWPVAYTNLNGQKLRIWESRLIKATIRDEAIANTTHAEPGTILKADKNGLVVATGSAPLRLTRLQLPGAKALPVEAILNAKRAFFAPGSRFDS